MKLNNNVFDLADVSLHNNVKDCWIIINARAYDVTNFLNDHPGGDNVLLDVAGKDASEEFEEAGHGSVARLMLDEYYVGEADLVIPSYGVSTITRLKAESRPNQQTVTQEDTRSWLGSMMKLSVSLLIPLAIFGVVIGVVLYK